MARSSLLGVDSAPAEAPGRDRSRLGPSDSTDSGSDLAGLDDEDDPADPGLPVDVALRDDQAAPLPLGESLAATDGDAGVRDGADIGVDRVFGMAEDAELDPEAAIDSVSDAPVDDSDDEELDDIEAEYDENGAGTLKVPRGSTDVTPAGTGKVRR